MTDRVERICRELSELTERELQDVEGRAMYLLREKVLGDPIGVVTVGGPDPDDSAEEGD